MAWIKRYKGPAQWEQDVIDDIRKYGTAEGGYTEADIMEGKRAKPPKMADDDFAFPEDMPRSKPPKRKKKKEQSGYAYAGPADGLLPDAYPMGSVDLSASDEFYRRKRERRGK